MTGIYLHLGFFIGGYANGVSAHGSQSDGDSVNTTVCYLFLFLFLLHTSRSLPNL